MYGKIFSQMYDGSLYGHWQALVTFQQMIVLADAKGVVDLTPEAIAARTSIPLDIVRQGIADLEAPDPNSRTPGHEGRRIIRLSEHRTWGWQIVNHALYRKIQSQEQRRQYMKEYQRERRRRETSGGRGQTVADRGEAWQTVGVKTGKQAEVYAGSEADATRGITPVDALTPVNSGKQCKPMQYAVSSKQETEKNYNPPTPLTADGADAPGVVVTSRNGNGKGNGRHLVLYRSAAKESRSLTAVVGTLQGFLATLAEENQREFEQDLLRDVMTDLVFAYWAKKLRHEGALLDPDRFRRIRKRLQESGDNVSELLYAVDGVKKDANLMGQNERGTKYDRISTIFRDREQVERLAELGGYRAGAVHPTAEKYLRTAVPAAGEVVSA